MPRTERLVDVRHFEFGLTEMEQGRFDGSKSTIGFARIKGLGGLPWVKVHFRNLGHDWSLGNLMKFLVNYVH